jgi:hypothetical protein
MISIFTRRPWAIYNPLKSWTLSGLSLREGQLLVASMTDAEMKVSWVYHEKWLNWRPLSGDGSCELFSFKDSDQMTLPPLPQIIQEDDHEITEVRMVSFSPKVSEPIRRQHMRFMAKFPVEIVVSSNIFPTHTLDLSEGGFCFKDKLPDWVAGYFTVVLNTSDKVFEFTCFLAEDQKNDKFRAEIAPTTSEKTREEFHLWLADQTFPEVPHK